MSFHSEFSDFYVHFMGEEGTGSRFECLKFPSTNIQCQAYKTTEQINASSVTVVSWQFGRYLTKIRNIWGLWKNKGTTWSNAVHSSKYKEFASRTLHILHGKIMKIAETEYFLSFYKLSRPGRWKKIEKNIPLFSRGCIHRESASKGATRLGSKRAVKNLKTESECGSKITTYFFIFWMRRVTMNLSGAGKYADGTVTARTPKKSDY